MKRFSYYILFLACLGSQPIVAAETVTLKSSSSIDETIKPSFPSILKTWKEQVTVQDPTIDKSVAAFAKFCSSLGMTIRPTNRYGIECYDILYRKHWYFVDPVTMNLYLSLDNETYVSSEELIDDPFLFLRAHSDNFQEGWKKFARFEVLHQSLGKEIKGSKNSQNILSLQPKDSAETNDSRASFDCASSIFTLDNIPGDAELICWQVAADPQFSKIQLQRKGNFEPSIKLTPIFETFLNSHETYFFRFKIRQEGYWSAWSQTLPFQISKPGAITSTSFESLGDGTYEICWNSVEGSDIEYFVYGSNALDFIPSAYCSEQPYLLNPDAIEMEENANFVAVTRSPRIQVDGSLAYYRIIAVKNGRLGTPSSIIHVYDHQLEQHRTILQTVSHEGIDYLCRRLEFPSYTEQAVYDSFSRPRFISPEIWAYTEPYFLPANHPIRPKLDRMFSQTRVTLTPDTFRKAGFKRYKPGRHSHIMASAHPRLEGYYVKAFSDAEKGVIDWKKLTTRIKGALSVKKYIHEQGYDKDFKVPKKWLYPLPARPSPPLSSRYMRKFFILIAEDMRCVTHEANNARYKNSMNKRLLDALFCIIRDIGLYDCVRNFNVPWCKDGKLAFIDTEDHHFTGNIRYEIMLRYLSPKMQIYWKTLMHHGGPVEGVDNDDEDTEGTHLQQEETGIA